MKQSLVLFAAALPAVADAFLACPGAPSTFSLRPAAGQRSCSAPTLRMASSPPPPGSEPALRKQWAGKQMDDWMVYATKKAERTDEEWKKIEEERSLKQAEVEKELDAFKAELEAKMAPGRAKEDGDQAFVAATEAFEEGDLETASAQWKVAAAKWGEAGIMVGIYAAGFKDALKELQDKIVEAGGSCDDM